MDNHESLYSGYFDLWPLHLTILGIFRAALSGTIIIVQYKCICKYMFPSFKDHLFTGNTIFFGWRGGLKMQGPLYTVFLSWNLQFDWLRVGEIDPPQYAPWPQRCWSDLLPVLTELIHVCYMFDICWSNVLFFSNDIYNDFHAWLI